MPASPSASVTTAADPAQSAPLGIAQAELEASGALWTAREIAQQPQMLEHTHALIAAEHARLQTLIAPVANDSNAHVVLTGAGTSAFIGLCLAPLLNRAWAARVEAIPTTDLVAAPRLYFDPDRPLLLVSYGRSGNSPESLAAIELAESLVANAHHLALTCNPDGALAKMQTRSGISLQLPEQTHDVSFAMTSSFSCMAYATLAAFSPVGTLDARIGALTRAMERVIETTRPTLKTLAGERHSRVVWLGSGLLQGLAREAALKLGEMTNGAVATVHDSPLGFRHGPKTFVDADTLVAIFVSNDPLTRQYDHDLIDELRADGIAARVIEVTAQPRPGLEPSTIAIPDMANAPDIDLLWPCVAAAQLYAFYASRERELSPDNPNPQGIVNRVVQGVRIHPLPPLEA